MEPTAQNIISKVSEIQAPVNNYQYTIYAVIVIFFLLLLYRFLELKYIKPRMDKDNKTLVEVNAKVGFLEKEVKKIDEIKKEVVQTNIDIAEIKGMLSTRAKDIA